MRFTKNTRILVIDTETTNTHDTAKGADMSDVLVYDCGWAVCDIHGNIYETASYVNRDIFYGEPDLMDSAFIPAGIIIVSVTFPSSQSKLMTVPISVSPVAGTIWG